MILKMSVFLSCICQDAFKMLWDLCSPQLPKENSFKELCMLLENHFISKKKSSFMNGIIFMRLVNRKVNELWISQQDLGTYKQIAILVTRYFNQYIFFWIKIRDNHGQNL